MGLIKNISASNRLPEIKIVEFDYFADLRGQIWTSYSSDVLNSLLPTKMAFKHDKFNTNKQNVLRGIHGDNKTWKLVSCPYGEIEQVVIDLRKESPSFKKWIKFHLSQENLKAILIPPGFGNAFCVLSADALYHYKLAYDGEYNDFDKQFTYAWNDQTIGIDWTVTNPITSERDMMESK